MLKNSFKFAARNIKYRPFRSWLTILGIIIGIMLIASLLSLAEGIRSAVLQQLRMLGTNLLYVMPGESTNPLAGFFGGVELSREDVKIIEKVEGIDLVVPMTTKALPMRFEGENKLVFLCGHPWKGTLDMLEEYAGWKLYKGRWPENGKRELTIGYQVAKKTFKKEIEPGGKVTISGRRFEVVGIVDKLGEQTMDSMVSIGLDLLREITGERKAVQTVMAKVDPDYDPEKVAEKVKNELKEERKRKRGQEEYVEDFTVLTAGKVSGVVGNVMGIIQWALIGIGLVAVVVGGIGIMNTMYTSTHERTKEIGIMKAIGARNSAILSIFLFEAGIIGLVGGLFGLIAGFGLAKFIEIIVHQKGFIMLQASITPTLILLLLGFSFLIGCISGFFPAWRASKLKPIDALRYE